MAQNFWMIVSSLENFQITRDLGFTAQGLKAQHRRKIQRIENGDRVLFYVYGSRKFTATATATSSYVEDDSGTWQKEGRAAGPTGYRSSLRWSSTTINTSMPTCWRPAWTTSGAGPRKLAHGFHREPTPSAQERFPPHRRGDEKAKIWPGIPANQSHSNPGRKQKEEETGRRAGPGHRPDSLPAALSLAIGRHCLA